MCMWIGRLVIGRSILLRRSCEWGIRRFEMYRMGSLLGVGERGRKLHEELLL